MLIFFDSLPYTLSREEPILRCRSVTHSSARPSSALSLGLLGIEWAFRGPGFWCRGALSCASSFECLGVRLFA